MTNPLFLLAVLPLALSADPRPGDWVRELLATRPASFSLLVQRPEDFRLQILVGEVKETEAGVQVVQHGFRVDAEYFYPASAIKICAAIAALEELNALRRAGWEELDETSPLVFHPLFPGERLETEDPSNLESGRITLEHEVRKLFLVSDNEAFNRLYELLGQERLHERTWDAGFDSVRCAHRLSEFRSFEEHRRTSRVDWLAGERLLVLPARTSELRLDNLGRPRLEVGRAQVVDGERVERPMSFRYKNRVSLVDLQAILLRLFGLAEPHQGARELDLTDAQRELVFDAMSQLPRESDNPRYDPAEYPDDYVKFLLPGIARVLPPERVQIFNKVGRAYGFSVENAYVVDRETGRAFFVAATIYTNSNGVLNDGVYEYETVADPFFADLGEVLARRLLVERE